MTQRQGEVYWVPLEALDPVDSDVVHPYVVLQDDLLNRTRVRTVVMCGLTSNLQRASEPGNVLLEPGEANLERQSVVLVARIATVNRALLGEPIGTLSPERLAQIFAGLRQLQWFTERR